MKILLVINELNIRGGTHKQLLRLCEYLEKENDIIIYTRNYDISKTYPEFGKFNIISADFNFPKRNNIFSKIINKIKNIKKEDKIINSILDDIDIVNIHDCGAIRVSKNAKMKNKKVVCQINDIPNYFLEGVANGQKDSYKNKIRRTLFKNKIKYVDEITVNVSKNKEVVKKCLNRESYVFYCGVDANDKLQIHTGMNKENEINLFSSGVFFPYRNYETLVKVVDKLVKNNQNVHLDIMGSAELDKEYSNSIKEMIKNMNLEEYITILGQVDDDKYVELHNNADIFLFININQSWGLAVFEAMSCGLPVIVSDSVGAIELLTDKENAIILDPENVDLICEEIIKLKDDENYYKYISNNACESVKEFTWDNLYSSKMLELFKKVSGE